MLFLAVVMDFVLLAYIKILSIVGIRGVGSIKRLGGGGGGSRGTLDEKGT